LTIEPPSVEALDAGVIEEANKRQRHHARAACAMTILVAAAAITVIVWSPGGGSGDRLSRRPVASPSPSASTSHRSQPARMATATTEARAELAALETRYFMVIPHSSAPAT
jgi:hypothetical protein